MATLSRQSSKLLVLSFHLGHVDGTCTLAISTENEARWYMDGGRYAAVNGHDDPPKVQCPVTIAVGGISTRAVQHQDEGLKQAPRFPRGRSER